LRLIFWLALALSACEASTPSEPGVTREALSAETNVDAPVVGPVPAVRQANFAAGLMGSQWLTAWSDQRLSNTGGWQVWGARVSLDGGVLDPFGLQLTYGRGGDHPAVACLSTYCWVTWVDYNSFEGVRVAANGTLLDGTVVTLSSTTGQMTDVSLATNGADFFAAWTDTRSGVPAIYGMAMLRDGGLPADVLISSGALARRRPTVVSVDAGYLVAWSDLRAGAADIWAVQVFDGGGTLGPELQLSNAATTDDFVSAAVDPTTGTTLVTWDTATDVVGRRVRADGVMLETTPFSIDSSTGTQRHAHTSFDGTRWIVTYEAVAPNLGATFVRTDGTVGTLRTLSDAGGDFPINSAIPAGALVGWANGLHLQGLYGSTDTTGFVSSTPVTVTQSANSQFDVDVAGVDGGFLVIWQDSRFDIMRPMARWFSPAGVATGVSFELSPAAARPNRGRSVVGGPSGQALAMWSTNTALQLVHLVVGGAPLETIPLSSASPGTVQDNPSGAFGPGAYLVVVEESNASIDLRGLVVSQSTGVPVTRVSIANGPSGETSPAVAGNATQFLAAWSEGAVLGYTRVDANGVVLDVPRRTVPGTATTRTNPAVASDGNGFLLVWLENGNTLLGARLDASGAMVDAAPFTLATLLSANVPCVVWDGQRYLVTWRLAGAALTRVVPPVGAPSTTISVVLNSAVNHRSAVMAMSGDDGLVVATSNQLAAPVASARVSFTHFTEATTAVPCTIELDCKTLSCVSGFCVAFDAGVPDAGTLDAGTPDAGAADAGVPDAGVPDAGVADAGVDAGLDAGDADAGVSEPDAGPSTPYALHVGCGCSTVDPLALIALLLFPSPLKGRGSGRGVKPRARKE
jgi:hypothetical protein